MNSLKILQIKIMQHISTSRGFFNVQNNKQNSDFLKKVLKKIMENEYISDSNKKKVRERYSKMVFYEDDDNDDNNEQN